MSHAKIIHVDLVWTTSVVGDGLGGIQGIVRLVDELWTADGKLVVSYDRYDGSPLTGDGLQQVIGQ